jgi:hypothetical protein
MGHMTFDIEKRNSFHIVPPLQKRQHGCILIR